MDTVLWILWAVGFLGVYVAACWASLHPFDERIGRLYWPSYGLMALAGCTMVVGAAYNL
jgi:hypothetical protein